MPAVQHLEGQGGKILPFPPSEHISAAPNTVTEYAESVCLVL